MKEFERPTKRRRRNAASDCDRWIVPRFSTPAPTASSRRWRIRRRTRRFLGAVVRRRRLGLNGRGVANDDRRRHRRWKGWKKRRHLRRRLANPIEWRKRISLPVFV